MKILHIINSLKKGGAEGNLYRLCEFQKKKYQNKIELTIITLIKNGYYEKNLISQGIKIFSLGISKKTKIIDLIKNIFNLRNIIKKENPDIIQSWMYHSNILTIFAPKMFHNKIIWNIRHSELNYKISKITTILISRICGLVSNYIPRKIIYCSETSMKFHEQNHSYKKNKSVLIYNGYSKKIYYPSNDLRDIFRKKNKLKKKDIVLGFAGRFAKQKNIEALLIAFSKNIKEHNNLYLYLVGKDVSKNNKKLIEWVSRLKIKNKTFFLNEQKNLLEFYNGIDLLLLPSHSESFPNVIAEAMLCSTPVLSSNAGCANKIIDRYGFIMKKNDHFSISKNIDKCLEVLKNDKKRWKYLKKNSQIKIKRDFSIEKMAKKYFQTWTIK
ncbi:glycosyltransferase [Candidatus Pelagibacter bacterium nBUS_49]|uniref:glycosyltransferase n=1 Tax=Candidatus Pelagibacter bacterium nBUS_49 TaxID=3374196 RepID=UPI003EBCE8D3